MKPARRPLPPAGAAGVRKKNNQPLWSTRTQNRSFPRVYQRTARGGTDPSREKAQPAPPPPPSGRGERVAHYHYANRGGGTPACSPRLGRVPPWVRLPHSALLTLQGSAPPGGNRGCVRAVGEDAPPCDHRVTQGVVLRERGRTVPAGGALGSPPPTPPPLPVCPFGVGGVGWGGLLTGVRADPPPSSSLLRPLGVQESAASDVDRERHRHCDRPIQGWFHEPARIGSRSHCGLRTPSSLTHAIWEKRSGLRIWP